MNKTMDVVYASDEYYFAYIYAAVKTLYEHNKEDDILVHYIQQNVSEKSLSILKSLAKEYNRDIDIITFSMPEEYDRILPAYGAASKTTYAKFWFASMFPDKERLLYLDPDTIVMGNIRELYDVEFNNNLIAGVIENLPTYHMKASKMEMDDSYINGGMMLCNLAQWRREGFEKKALERLKDTVHNLNYDQGIVNELCKKSTLVVPPKYNVLAEIFEFKSAEKIKKRYGFTHYYSQQEVDEAINSPIIIHFTGFLYGKPLSVKCTHPYTEYFQNIIKNSPLEDVFNEQDINRGQKIRQFFLHKLPFNAYLLLENVLDVRRSLKL